ncbi:MAG TPA: hypothetical protein VFJ43_09010, partial [Bacteroidia bacterium]|nr:hypothetical protein [Bacteroidia bacterium]
LTAFLFIGFFFISNPASAQSKTKAGDVSFVITNKTTQAQLDSLQKALAAQGIELSLAVVYNSSREVKKISGTIVFSPTQSGTFSNDNMGTVSVSRKGKNMKIVSKDPDGK